MKKDVKPTREAVLDSAIAAFGRKGYAGTSVSDIVQATGLSKPTLYYYFGSKEGLFCAILESAYDGSARRMEENMHGADGCYDKLVEAATGLFEFASAHQDLMRLVFSSMFAAPGEKLVSPVTTGCEATKLRTALPDWNWLVLEMFCVGITYSASVAPGSVGVHSWLNQPHATAPPPRSTHARIAAHIAVVQSELPLPEPPRTTTS